MKKVLNSIGVQGFGWMQCEKIVSEIYCGSSIFSEEKENNIYLLNLKQ